MLNKIERDKKDISKDECLRTKSKTNKKDFNPDLNSYMKVLNRHEKLIMQCLKEMKEIKEKTGKAVGFNDLPSNKKFQNSYKKLLIKGNSVEYCGKNASIWYNIGMRNENKIWKIREVWKSTMLKREKVMERIVTWEGTLEEYVQNYGLVIKYSNLPYRGCESFFCGLAKKNIPEEMDINDLFDLEAWIVSAT